MSKLILQGLLSLFVSLGVIVGVNSNARSEVKQVWQEAKATVHQAVGYVADTAGDLTSRIDANVKAGAESNSDVSFGNMSSDAQAGIEADAQTDVAVGAGSGDGFFLDPGGDASTGFNLNFNFWK